MKREKSKLLRHSCKLCDTTNILHVAKHLKYHHQLTMHEYYDKFYLTEKNSICQNINCQNQLQFKSLRSGYGKYCSHSCKLSQLHKDPIFQKINSDNLRNKHLDAEFKKAHAERSSIRLQALHTNIEFSDNNRERFIENRSNNVIFYSKNSKHQWLSRCKTSNFQYGFLYVSDIHHNIDNIKIGICADDLSQYLLQLRLKNCKSTIAIIYHGTVEDIAEIEYLIKINFNNIDEVFNINLKTNILQFINNQHKLQLIKTIICKQ